MSLARFFPTHVHANPSDTILDKHFFPQGFRLLHVFFPGGATCIVANLASQCRLRRRAKPSSACLPLLVMRSFPAVDSGRMLGWGTTVDPKY